MERVWGRKALEPWYPNQGKLIGELWFETPEIPLLVKFLFTAENLSVQVHPDDDYAREHEKGSPGKTEMWHVLAAEPGAKIAAGFREKVDIDQARRAAESGEIELMLAWHDAAAGDTFFIPAGTVHAIGAGLTICEIQQQSDVTYRLYDYNRLGLDGKPRQLHLEHGFHVSKLDPAAARHALPVECKHFVTEHVTGSVRVAATDRILIAIHGEGSAGEQPVRAGDVFLIPANWPELTVSGDVELLVTGLP